MAVRATTRRVPDTYLKLVKRFPLIHIRDESHLVEALEFLNELLRHDGDEGIQEYLNVLTDLVAAYEDEHVPIADVSEAEVLRELLRSNALSQMGLAKAVGISQSTISAVLTGTRSLTKEQILKLAKFFGIAPAAFLPRHTRHSRRATPSVREPVLSRVSSSDRKAKR
jgi:HTH-type transcriptional regulator / antitoxin HigA